MGPPTVTYSSKFYRFDAGTFAATLDLQQMKQTTLQPHPTPSLRLQLTIEQLSQLTSLTSSAFVKAAKHFSRVTGKCYGEQRGKERGGGGGGEGKGK